MLLPLILSMLIFFPAHSRPQDTLRTKFDTSFTAIECDPSPVSLVLAIKLWLATLEPEVCLENAYYLRMLSKWGLLVLVDDLGNASTLKTFNEIEHMNIIGKILDHGYDHEHCDFTFEDALFCVDTYQSFTDFLHEITQGWFVGLPDLGR